VSGPVVRPDGGRREKAPPEQGPERGKDERAVLGGKGKARAK
jgi:hypothetical protein